MTRYLRKYHTRLWVKYWKLLKISFELFKIICFIKEGLLCHLYEVSRDFKNIMSSRMLARIPKLAVQKFFWEWPNIFVGVVALKVFWDVATKTVAIKHMCWSNKAIIVFLNRRFKLLTSVLYARIIIMDAQTWQIICVCSNQPYPGIFNLFLTEKSRKADTGNKLNIKTIKNIRGMLKSL